MNCKTCAAPTKEIAAKTTGRGADGITKCHRLECGHAWHVTTPAADGREPHDIAPTPCACGEIVTVNELLVAGSRLTRPTEELSEDGFHEWSQRVLAALDGIPAESGAPSLVRSATTVAKSSTSSRSKKIADLNNLLVRAIKAVS